MGSHPRLLALPLIAILASACTSPASDLPDLPPIESGSEIPSPTGEPGDAFDGPGRLLILDGSGNVVTMRPDGSDIVALTEGTGQGLAFLQPTWSPDGRRVAWTQIDSSDGSPSASLVTSSVDGTQRTEATTDVTGFYLSWDPTSSRIAFLGAAGEEIELGIVDVVRGGTEATPLARGRPFYFSWAPDGDRMLAHVGNERIEELGLDGSVTRIDAVPASFQAPIWSPEGSRRVYAERKGARQRIVVASATGLRPRGLVEFAGDALFVMSPDSSRLAYRAVGEHEGGDGVGFAQVRARSDELSVIDLESGRSEPVSEEGALAFFWGPDGRLLFLSVEVDAGAVWLRWNVWDGLSTNEFGRFRPSETLARDYLPFFDQYAQSLSLWAPDGSAFAYPGMNEAGESGIWIQSASPGAEAVLVTNGQFVAWSPT